MKSDSDFQLQPVIRTSRKNYAVDGKSKEITSTVLLSIDELDEVYPLMSTRPGKLNWSHFVKEIEKTCLINVEKSYSMFYTLLSGNGSQAKRLQKRYPNSQGDLTLTLTLTQQSRRPNPNPNPTVKETSA